MTTAPVLTGEKEIGEVKKQADRLEKKTVRFLRDLIALPSPSTKEARVVKRIKKEMEAAGYDEVFVDKVGNIIGRIGSGRVRVLYDSHVDTVDVGTREAWTFDPFAGKVEEGAVWGRGASDNKAGMACMVMAGRLIKQLLLERDFTLYVMGSVQEEDCDGLAMQHALEHSIPHPEFVVLGECTNLAVYRGHRGRLEIRISARGVSCHASAPERGDNAVTRMARLVKEIDELNQRLKPDPFLGKGSVAVTQIGCQSGSFNTVPDECSVILDRRLTGGETRESALAELRALPSFDPQKMAIEVLPYQAVSHTGLEVRQEKYFPTWTVPEAHPLVQAGKQAGHWILGRDPLVDKWTFSTNGVASMGRMDIPTIGFGPSEECFAHSVQDQVTLEHLRAAVAFYTLFPHALLGCLEP